MSVMNGTFAPETLYPNSNPFGTPFREVCKIPLARAWDVATYGRYIVAVGIGKLAVYDIKDGTPVQIGELDTIGASRQLAVCGDIAYLTARENGLYIIDLNGGKPKLIGHVDTLELATGIACADGILAVTNRHMGCELFDVRDPYHPERLGDFTCIGEAQSVCLHENFAVVSDWMNKRIRIFDVSNPRAGKEISRFNVDGFADGVCIFKIGPDTLHPLGRTICAAASGHHSARLKNRRKYEKYSFVTAEMLAEGYGCGHGVEFFDITDPTNPEYVSSLKAPPHFGGPDTWRVTVAGNLCYFVDSIGGIFEIDISDIENPYFTRYFRLPQKETRSNTPPSIQPFCGAVTGMALTENYVCAAGDDGVFILERKNGDILPQGEIQPQSAKVDFSMPEREAFNPKLKTIAKFGQLHSFVKVGNEMLCAAGNSGIVELSTGKSLTCNICCDITLFGDIIISSEMDDGIAAYSYQSGSLTLIDRMTFGVSPVREAVCIGKKLVIQIGIFQVRTLSFDGHFKQCGETQYIGMLYHRHIARTPAGACPVIMTLNCGTEFLMPSDDGGFVRSQNHVGLETCPIEEGACGCGDGAVIIFNRRYYYIEKPEDVTNLPNPIGCAGAMLNGIPFVCGSKLVLLNRVTGRVEILDITNPTCPKFEERIETGLYPEYAAEVDGRILIACGHGGIIEI